MEDLIKNLIEEMMSHKHALCLSNKNIVELIGLLKDKKKLDRERGGDY
jgi:hypothetical protein